MPRALRVEYEGAIYHVLNRGDRREDIFFDDTDREMFVRTLGQACGKAGWKVHAYCLMRNHFHLVMETPQPTLVAGMKWLLGTYTQRFNARHRMRGHLFAGRYKALLVDGSESSYLRAVCDYVHLNPARAGIVESGRGLESYRWSSYPAYLMMGKRPDWLRVDRLLGGHGIFGDEIKGRREFSRRMEERREEEDDCLERIRRGWIFGAEDFLNRLKEKIGPASPDSHEAMQVQEAMRWKAQRLMAELLEKEGIREEELPGLPKGHGVKLRIAQALRAETTLTLREVALLLHAGSWRSLANALSKERISYM